MRWKACKCPVCKETLDGVQSLTNPEYTPQEGSFSICAYCWTISIFQKDGSLKVAKDEEIPNEVRKAFERLMYGDT